MSANTYTTTDLVNNIQLVAHMPVGNQTFTASQIITLADRELQTSVMKLILSTRGGFYLNYEDQDQNSVGLYNIPNEAISGILANVEIVQDQNIIQVDPIAESEQYSTTGSNSTGYGFFMRGNSVQILPTPTNGVVRLWFYRRPSQLVQTSQASQITDINGSIVSVSSFPSTMLINTPVDLLQDQPNFDILEESVLITDINGTNLTLSDVPTKLRIGDWIALHNQTPIPQIPVEFRVLLEQRTVVKVYELQGYLDKAKMAQAKLTELQQDMTSLITNRVKNKTVVLNQSTGGLINNSANMGRFPAGRE